MKKWALAVVSVLFIVSPSAFSKFGPFGYYNYADFEESLRVPDFSQAAERLDRCVRNSKNPDHKRCVERKEGLKKGMTIEAALREEVRVANERADEEKRRRDFLERIDELRQSKNPWDKYLLFSELSAGNVEPRDPQEATRLASEAFAGFGECAKGADPSCMGMYGDLILRGLDSLPSNEKVEARRKAVYWLTLAARYGYVSARRLLIGEGENVPSPDLAMEQLQKEANSIAKDTVATQERLGREQAVRDYELIREQRRRTEQMIWANVFPKLVSCTSTAIGSSVYTNCR